MCLAPSTADAQTPCPLTPSPQGCKEKTGQDGEKDHEPETGNLYYTHLVNFEGLQGPKPQPNQLTFFVAKH